MGSIWGLELRHRQSVKREWTFGKMRRWISADADPAGVDMTWGMGRVRERLGLPWEPFRMGID